MKKKVVKVTTKNKEEVMNLLKSAVNNAERITAINDKIILHL